MEHLVRSQRGMTLMEIMIAAAIIGIGLAAVSAAVPFAVYGVQEGHQLPTAAFLATERLEEVRSSRWELGPPAIDDLGLSASATAAPVSGTVTTFPDEAALAGPHAGYALSVRINDCGAGAGCS